MAFHHLLICLVPISGISYMRVLGFLGLCGHYEDEFLKDAAVRLEDEFAGEFLDYTIWKMNFWVCVFCLLFVLLLLGRRNTLLKLSMLYSAVEWYPWYPCVVIHDGSVIVLHCLPSAFILFVKRWHRVLYFNSCCSMILGRNLYKGS